MLRALGVQGFRVKRVQNDLNSSFFFFGGGGGGMFRDQALNPKL